MFEVLKTEEVLSEPAHQTVKVIARWEKQAQTLQINGEELHNAAQLKMYAIRAGINYVPLTRMALSSTAGSPTLMVGPSAFYNNAQKDAFIEAARKKEAEKPKRKKRVNKQAELEAQVQILQEDLRHIKVVLDRLQDKVNAL